MEDTFCLTDKGWMQWAAQVDIRYWMAFYKGICPNCGMNLNTVHRLYNLAPHFYKQCVSGKEGRV